MDGTEKVLGAVGTEASLDEADIAEEDQVTEPMEEETAVGRHLFTKALLETAHQCVK